MTKAVYLLYADETNRRPNQVFFIYGGIVVDSDQAGKLHERIRGIRKRHGVGPTTVLKLSPAPQGLRQEDFVKLKVELVGALQSVGGRVLVNATHHDVTRNKLKLKEECHDLQRYSINALLYAFHKLLVRESEYGLFILDSIQFDPAHREFMREKFQLGLRFDLHESGSELVRLVGIHQSHVEQSHLASLADIVVGTFRQGINALLNLDKRKDEPQAGALLRPLASLFPRGKNGQISNSALKVYPRKRKAPNVDADCRELEHFLAKTLIANGV